MLGFSKMMGFSNTVTENFGINLLSVIFAKAFPHRTLANIPFKVESHLNLST
jgi:hypothetical protein